MKTLEEITRETAVRMWIDCPLINNCTQERFVKLAVPFFLSALREARPEKWSELIKRVLPHVQHKRDCLANAHDDYPKELRELDKLVIDLNASLSQQPSEDTERLEQ